MSQLIDKRKEIVIKLESFPEDTITIYDDLLAGDSQEATAITGDAERTFFVILKLIKSWTFTGTDEKPLPVTSDNLKLLPMKDYMILVEKMNDIFVFNKEKKMDK